jgi:hypothetical protein
LEEISTPTGRARLLNEAYLMLAGSRQIGMNGPQPIGLADTLMLYDRIDLDMDLKEFVLAVQEIDSGYMKAVENRQGGSK